MRFESFMWAALAVLLAGGTLWDDGAAVQPTEASIQFDSKDGSGKVPPE